MSEGALVPIEAHAVATPLDNSTPATLVRGAKEMATTLADVIKGSNMSVTIQGREYVKVEGWTTLLAMLGVTPREVEVIEDYEAEQRYIAKVELVNAQGRIIASASAECGRSERQWKTRDNYALRSMAITRATGKAARMAFSWIVTMSGYEATPAEEIPREGFDDAPKTVEQPESGEPKDHRIHFGKNKGKSLQEIGTRSAQWYHKHINEKIEKGERVSDEDRALVDAIKAWFDAGSNVDPNQEVPF